MNRQLVDFRETFGIPIVELYGEADLANVDELRAALDAAEDFSASTVIVSLMHAEYFDSSTIYAIVTTCKRLEVAGRRLIVIGPSGDSGRRILAIFRLREHLSIVDTMPEALATALACAEPDSERSSAT